MSRFARAVALTVLTLAIAVPIASAHQGNPNYRSVLRGLAPTVPGVRVDVLGYDNQLQIINTSGERVVVPGYQGEPYAALLPDGTVEINRRSPATYLNEDRLGDTPVPAGASPKGAPRWQVLDKTGRFVWHDHRMHWMGIGLPPQVKDRHHRTKIFDYRIPITVGDRPAVLTGTLFWVGTPSGFPAGALVSLVAVALAGVAVALLVRRRRAGARASARLGPKPVREAW